MPQPVSVGLHTDKIDVNVTNERSCYCLYVQFFLPNSNPRVKRETGFNSDTIPNKLLKRGQTIDEVQKQTQMFNGYKASIHKVQP